MKEGWKKFTFKNIIKTAKVSKAGNGCDYPVLSITMRDGIVFQNDRFKKVIASKDTSGYKVVNNGQLVIAFPIDEGLIYTQDIAEKGIMSPAYNIYDVNYSVINRVFLVKYFHSRFAMNYYKEKQRCTTQRRRVLPKEELENLPIPVPPLSEQQQIVEELDLLSGIIEKKKEQLKELDNLAQSIFYEMFGDSVANEKGWEKKKASSILEVIGGYAFKSEKFTNSGIPVLRIGNINSGAFKPDNLVFWGNDKALKRYEILPGDVVLSLTGTVGKDDYGNICILGNDYPKYYLNQRNAKFELSDSIDKYYLAFLFKFDKFKRQLTDVSRGVRQANISNKDILNLTITLPPLPLQQSFASKIEAIEKQKALIKQSITETETLFNSRMDYYFG